MTTTENKSVKALEGFIAMTSFEGPDISGLVAMFAKNNVYWDKFDSFVDHVSDRELYIIAKQPNSSPGFLRFLKELMGNVYPEERFHKLKNGKYKLTSGPLAIMKRTCLEILKISGIETARKYYASYAKYCLLPKFIK